jgi:MoaA/NifB/PqqE/SkfB family radical SAM enzyme
MDLATAKEATELYFRQRNPHCTSPYIMLFGGEPLLNWELVVKYVPWLNDNRGLHFNLLLFTNGLAATEDRIRFLAAQNVRLFFSLDGDYRRFREVRPVTKREYEHILSMMRYYLELAPDSAIPYCVIRNKDIHSVPEIVESIASLGFKHIALARDLTERWEGAEKVALVNHVRGLQQAREADLLPFPEATADCFGSCYPRSMMVYPDGEIYDLCYVCATAAHSRGLINSDDMQALFMGDLATSGELSLDVERKKKTVRSHVHCAFLSVEPEA